MITRLGLAVLGVCLLGACGNESSDPLGSGRSGSTESATRPIVADGQLKTPSVTGLAETMGALSVVDAVVVDHIDVPVGVPYATASESRTVCELKVTKTIAGPEVVSALVGCAFPDRVVPSDDAEQYRQAKEKGILPDDSDPAAVSMLPKAAWPVGTASVFVISPVVGAPSGVRETYVATPVLLDERAGTVTLSPRHLTRAEYAHFNDELTVGVADLVRLNELFIESRPERDAAGAAEIDAIKARWAGADN